MKVILSERNIVIVLFVMVLVTFSLAQEDSKEMEKGLNAVSATSTSFKLAKNTATDSTLQSVDINKQ